jgi:ribosome maturation factor RimP
MEAVDQIRAVAERVVKAHGLDLFDVQLRRESLGWIVRVTIDRPGPAATAEESVSVEDCALVSRELSTILDVEEPLPRAYTLEVTSPGLDRPLRDEADYRRFAGRLARIVVEPAVDGQTFFSGRLKGIDEGDVVLEIGKRAREQRVPLAAIKRARLAVEF